MKKNMKHNVVIATLLFSAFAHADNKKTNCDTVLSRSTATINQILVDLNNTYKHVGGGGITSIQQTATDTYLVSVSQEERIDQIHYTVKLDKSCQLRILEKHETTKSFQ